MANRLSLLQTMAYRRYLRKDQPSHPRTVAGPPEERSPAKRWRGRFAVGEEYRGGRRRARLRRWKEGKGQSKRHILVDTEGFVRSRRRSTAPRSWITRGSRRCYGELRSNF